MVRLIIGNLPKDTNLPAQIAPSFLTGKYLSKLAGGHARTGKGEAAGRIVTGFK
jgi:hypothetical protein